MVVAIMWIYLRRGGSRISIFKIAIHNVSAIVSVGKRAMVARLIRHGIFRCSALYAGDVEIVGFITGFEGRGFIQGVIDSFVEACPCRIETNRILNCIGIGRFIANGILDGIFGLELPVVCSVAVRRESFGSIANKCDTVGQTVCYRACAYAAGDRRCDVLKCFQQFVRSSCIVSILLTGGCRSCYALFEEFADLRTVYCVSRIIARIISQNAIMVVIVTVIVTVLPVFPALVLCGTITNCIECGNTL